MSRVFRLSEPAGLKTLRFLDFDEQSEGQGGLGVFVEDEPAARALVVDTPGSGAPGAAITREQLEEARSAGYRQALDEGAAALVSAADALSQALNEVTRLRASLLKNSTEDMVQLVMAISEQVIGAEVATRPEFVFDTLKSALQNALKADEYEVRVHPDDLAQVVEHKPLFLAAVSGLRELRFGADAKISRGGCIVESRLGQVDATIDSRLDEIRSRLQEHLGAR